MKIFFMLKGSVLLLGVLLGLKSHAEPINFAAAELEIMKAALSSAEMGAELQQLESLKANWMACEREQRLRQIPYNCFSVYNNKARHQYSIKVDLDSSALERLCLRAAESTLATEILPNSQLSDSCLISLKERLAVNKYKTGKNWQAF